MGKRPRGLPGCNQARKRLVTNLPATSGSRLARFLVSPCLYVFFQSCASVLRSLYFFYMGSPVLLCGGPCAVNQWAWGHMSPIMVQQIARLHKQDLETPGLNMDLLTSLVELGGKDGSAANKGNMLRDLTKNLPDNDMPPLRFHEIQIDHPVLGKSTPEFPFLDQHELFSVLYHRYPQSFFKHVVPSTEALENFWDSVSGVWGKHRLSNR